MITVVFKKNIVDWSRHIKSPSHVTISLLILFVFVPLSGESSGHQDDHRWFMVLSAQGQTQESGLSLIRAAAYKNERLSSPLALGVLSQHFHATSVCTCARVVTQRPWKPKGLLLINNKSQLLVVSWCSPSQPNISAPPQSSNLNITHTISRQHHYPFFSFSCNIPWGN